MSHLDLLELLIPELRGILGEGLVGLYQYGSSVSGGFDPDVSDIDLAAVTSVEVDAIDLAGLEQMHRRLVVARPEWADRVEVVYVGRASLQSFRTTSGALAVISPGEPFHVRHDRAVDWLQNWYLIRQTGVTLFGAEAAEIIPPIAWSEFVTATVRYASEVRGRSRAGARPGALAYTILTLCRALYTVRLQAQASKQASAEWTRTQLPQWAWLIDEALRCRLSGGAIGFGDAHSRAAAETFIALLADQVSGAPA